MLENQGEGSKDLSRNLNRAKTSRRMKDKHKRKTTFPNCDGREGCSSISWLVAENRQISSNGSGCLMKILFLPAPEGDIKDRQVPSVREVKRSLKSLLCGIREQKGTPKKYVKHKE